MTVPEQEKSLTTSETSLPTIIGFDSWTAGAAHYSRLVNSLSIRGYRLLLIHIGSWGHETNRPPEEYIDGLLIRDISFYKNKSIKEILEAEKPCAIVFLSTRAFAHQAVNRYAKYLSIPTLHLYHGLVNVQALSHPTRQAQKLNFSRQAVLIKNRLVKNLFRLIPTYAKSLWQTKASMSDWFWLLREAIVKCFRGTQDVAPPDTATTRGCVYVDIDVKHMIENYHMNECNVRCVGNPDLARFGLSPDMIGLCSTPEYRPRAQVMYIDTSLVEAGLCFASRAEFFEHLRETHSSLSAQGLELVVKLHPAHFQSDVPSLLMKSNIRICQNDEFVAQLKNSCGVIVEPSTAAMLPAIMGLPILLAQYNKLDQLLYGEVLIHHPRAHYLRDLDSTKELIENIHATPLDESFERWVANNIGPLPAEKMPDRVADVLTEMIKHAA